jgi:hypothetical protein
MKVPSAVECEHDWSVEIEIPADTLPRYVTPPVYDKYCAHCGVKQTFRERVLAAEAAHVVLPPVVPPPPPTPIRTDPEPIPFEDIVVVLDVERYGKRYDNNRRRGIKDRAIHIEGDLRRNEALAAAAEEYIAKALGLRYVGDVAGPDKGYDLMMRGRRIQVKWSGTHGNRLISSPTQTTTADYYVLVTGPDPSDFRVPGWATLGELKASTRDLGYGPTYCVEQADLRPFNDLLEIRREGL